MASMEKLHFAILMSSIENADPGFKDPLHGLLHTTASFQGLTFQEDKTRVSFIFFVLTFVGWIPHMFIHMPR